MAQWCPCWRRRARRGGWRGGRCRTKRLRLRGGGSASGGPAIPAAARRVDAGTRTHLRARYGSEAADVLALAEGRPELLEPVLAGLPYLGAEVVYAARAEMATSIDDVLARRTRALLQDARSLRGGGGGGGALLAPELAGAPSRSSPRRRRFADVALAALVAAGLPGAPGAGGSGTGPGDDGGAP